MIQFVEPESLEEACAILVEEEWGAKVISGGTALVLMMRQGLVAPSKLVSLGRIEGLGGIRTDGDRMTIGSRVTHREVAESPEVTRWAPSLTEACSRVGNPRIRNVGTIGGNLAEADYAADPPTVLVSLDAVCHITGPSGRRELPVSELATGFYSTDLVAGEVITAVSLGLGEGRATAYERFVSRSSEDRPCVGVAATAVYEGPTLANLNVVVGAAAAVPTRFDDVAEMAIGTDLDENVRRDIAARVSEGIEPIEDGRGSSWYRRKVTAALVNRVLDRVRR